MEELQEKEFGLGVLEGMIEVVKNGDKEKIEKLEKFLQTLTPREERVVRMRIGLDDGQPKSLEEIAKFFDVTRERIRQIMQKALLKGRHIDRSKKLSDYIEEQKNDDGLMEKFKNEIVNIINNNADETTSKIVVARFGIEDGKTRRLSEVQEMFPQYTCEQIKQIIENFIEQLRDNSNKR